MAHAQVMTNWTINRLNWIAKTGTPSNIVLLLKSRNTDSNNMNDYIHTFPGIHYNALRDPYLSWVEGSVHNPSLTKGYREKFTDGSLPWLTGIKVKGFTWFEHLANMVTAPLPVMLLYFSVSKTDLQRINLHWKTSEEVNHAYFEIERSSNGRSWENLSKIVVTDNAKQDKSYRWVDHHPLRNAAYYRLKMVDKQGEISFSKIKSVSNANWVDPMEIYPNPAQKKVTLTLQYLSSDASFVIYNSVGQKLKNLNYTIKDAEINIDISKIPVGLYTVQIGGNSKRFIKDQ